MVKGTRGSYLFECSQPGCGVQPASYSVDTGALRRGVKWNGRETGPQSVCSAEVKLCFHSLICLRGMHRDFSHLREINTKASGMCKI